MNVAVIGAGASGLTAALQSAWHGAAVTLFERNAAVGRKLLVTGSGRCNITNEAVEAAKYACADPAWMEALLSRFGVGDLKAMLASIGIPVHKTSDGWYYPLSNSAQSVVAAFASALKQAGVTLYSQTQVSSLHASPKGFAVGFSRDGKEQAEDFERVIVSAGGKAYPSLGSRGELFPVLESLGHTVVPKRPALAPLLADLGEFKAAAGHAPGCGRDAVAGAPAPGGCHRKSHFYRMGLERPGGDGYQPSRVCPARGGVSAVARPAGVFPGRL